MTPEILPESSLSPQLDPHIDAPRIPKATIRIVTERPEFLCQFWVGVVESGTMPAGELLNVKTMDELLTKARKPGIEDDGPIALSDSARSPERFALLIPGPDSNDATSTWAGRAAREILNWNPKSIGLYFAPISNNTQEPLNALIAVIRNILDISPTLPIFLLAGEYGLNRILNITLKLRDELDPDQLTLEVLH